MYVLRDSYQIRCAFELDSLKIKKSAEESNLRFKELPDSLYRSIDLKSTSSIVGAVFVECLVHNLDNAIVNPIEKGHPDIIPSSAANASEASLRNYGTGLEIKTTVGNVKTGSNLNSGETRVEVLTGITWQAHHKEVKELLGLVWDFVQRKPIITGAFFSNDLQESDWGEIAGTTGRNTKVCGMKASGKGKMGNGWLLLLNQPIYKEKYSNFLGFNIP